MEWISVEDRLPETDNLVLVGDFRHDISHSLKEDYYFLGYYKSGLWRANTFETFVEVSAGWNGGTIVSRVDQEEVTHWMPLPEPPKD